MLTLQKIKAHLNIDCARANTIIAIVVLHELPSVHVSVFCV